MDERSPIYGKSRHYRVVSRPNGTWRAEQRDADRIGRNRNPEIYQAHYDPWTPLSRDTTREAALALIPKD
jgi:hypothetical protein